jgi:hypothetical protein
MSFNPFCTARFNGASPVLSLMQILVRYAEGSLPDLGTWRNIG